MYWEVSISHKNISIDLASLGKIHHETECRNLYSYHVIIKTTLWNRYTCN